MSNSFFAKRTKEGGYVDYYKDMDAHNFEKWFTENLIPNLPSKSVVAMDNARYHCRKSERLPTIRDTKPNIVKWLDDHSIAHPDPATTLKVALIEICKSHFTGERFHVDDIATEHGHEILHLPPYHCHFNPIECI